MEELRYINAITYPSAERRFKPKPVCYRSPSSYHYFCGPSKKMTERRIEMSPTFTPSACTKIRLAIS